MESTARKRKGAPQSNTEDAEDDAAAHVPSPPVTSKKNRRRKRRNTTQESASISNKTNLALVNDLLLGDATYDDVLVELPRSTSMPLPHHEQTTHGLVNTWLIANIRGFWPFHRVNTDALPPSTSAQQHLTSLTRSKSPSTHSNSPNSRVPQTNSSESRNRGSQVEYALVSGSSKSTNTIFKARSPQASRRMTNSAATKCTEELSSCETSSNNLETGSLSEMSIDNLHSMRARFIDNSSRQFSFEHQSSPECVSSLILSSSPSSQSHKNSILDEESSNRDDDFIKNSLLCEIAAENKSLTTEGELPFQHGWPPSSKPIHEHSGERHHREMLAILYDNGRSFPVSVFCDSGVRPSFITLKCVNEHELELQPLLVSDTRVYRGINGQDFETSFYVTVGLKIKGVNNDEVIEVRFRVLIPDGQDNLEEFLESFEHDIILGWDFIDGHGIWKSPWVKSLKNNKSNFLIVIDRPPSKSQKERMEKDKLDRLPLALSLNKNIADSRSILKPQGQEPVRNQASQVIVTSIPANPSRVDSFASRRTTDSGYLSMNSMANSSVPFTPQRSDSFASKRTTESGYASSYSMSLRSSNMSDGRTPSHSSGRRTSSRSSGGSFQESQQSPG